VHGVKWLLEVAMHDEISVGQPDFPMMVERIQVIIAGLVVVPQSRVIPLLLKKKLHFVFLEQKENKNKHQCLHAVDCFSVRSLHTALYSTRSRCRISVPIECLLKTKFLLIFMIRRGYIYQVAYQNVAANILN